ncbi:MAG: type II secretion system protein [Planctomycetota bacterium]
MNRAVGRRAEGMRARGGYTLIELIITIVILAIAAAVMIPSMGGGAELRLRAAARTVISDITFAQADAAAFQDTRAVQFDTAANRYTVSEMRVTGNGTNVQFEPLYFARGPNDRFVVDIGSAGFGSTVIASADFDGDETLAFDELGTPVLSSDPTTTSDGGKVTLTLADATLEVNIAPYTGRVSVTKP